MICSKDLVVSFLVVHCLVVHTLRSVVHLALMTSSSEELRDAAIAGAVALTTLAEASTVEKIVNYLLEQLSGSYPLFVC